ncbi:MAG: signal peptidase I, partial [Pseudomonadota bacterium]
SRVSQAALGVGPVPYKNLIGRADRIMFSSGGWSLFYFWTWRADRFFKSII